MKKTIALLLSLAVLIGTFGNVNLNVGQAKKGCPLADVLGYIY